MKSLHHQTTTHLTDDQDPIIALCTPRGSGALALIRISGEGTINVADAISKLSSGQSLSNLPSHTIHHGYIVAGNQKVDIIDEVLFFLMLAPRTFTGQDTIEISCHNNPFIIERIINIACAAGARHARPGEFTKRSFLAGKIDLIQAESINDLIHAPSQAALNKALAQVKGSLSHHLQLVEEHLVELITLVEASFEFIEEEQRDLSLDEQIKAKTTLILTQLATLKKYFHQQRHIKQGIRIALIGTVNTGKSTLFNTLVGEQRAITANQAGTTRDSIEATRYVNGHFWTLIDTAGLRETADMIEQQGIERSFQEAQKADIIILVCDGTRNFSLQEQQIYQKIYEQHSEKSIVVINKIDHTRSFTRPAFFPNTLIEVSALNGHGIENLEASLEQKIIDLFAQFQSPFLLNQRHYTVLEKLSTKLITIEEHYQKGIHYELVSCELLAMLEQLSSLTGKNVHEKVLDTIFNNFCVGK